MKLTKLTLMLATLSFSSLCFAEKVEVGILFFDGVQIIDFAAPFEVFGQAKYEVLTVSKTGESVKSAMNLTVTPDYSFETLPSVDVIVVPGGHVHDVMEDEATLAWLQQRNKTAKHTLSVCTGSHILAEAGLLDDLTSTTFHRALDSFEKNYPKTKVIRDQRFADNGKVITSAGLSSGMDAALHVVSKLSGLDQAKTIAMHIEYDWQLEDGFVRAQMADQYLPKNQYSFPNDAQFKQLYNYGDKQHWKTAYRVSTKAGAEALLEAITNAMAAHKSQWKSLKNQDKYQLDWQKVLSSQNQHMTIHLKETDQPDQYVISQTLDIR